MIYNGRFSNYSIPASSESLDSITKAAMEAIKKGGGFAPKFKRDLGTDGKYKGVKTEGRVHNDAPMVATRWARV